MAKKLQSSLAVEGELPEEGLAAYGDDGDDLMMALARRIVSGDKEEDAETMEEVFAQARDAEATAEEYLVNDGWKAVEIEPEAVEVNGNGHSDEAPEPQQTLFSWAEFMAEEPVKPKGRKRKAQPARFMCAALFCCPFSGGALIPLLRSPSSATDGPSGEAAGMEANKRRLTLDLASTFQRWLKVWRSRASACGRSGQTAVDREADEGRG